MLGSIQRTVKGIEVTDDTLSFEVIRDVVLGEGHYLGHNQTISRMESDYYYPIIGDRNSPSVWEENGSKDIRERAKEKVRSILSSHYPTHISEELDQKLRSNFKVLLPREAMLPGNGRW
jgi:trimethylamine--corrinoid protein Co-methyltransferase